MKKIILVSLITISSVANASLPVRPPSSPGGGIVAAMRGMAELQNQQLQNQMLQEQLAMMRQQQVMMKMQGRRS
jgi:hypothetical protein